MVMFYTVVTETIRPPDLTCAKSIKSYACPLPHLLHRTDLGVQCSGLHLLSGYPKK